MRYEIKQVIIDVCKDKYNKNSPLEVADVVLSLPMDIMVKVEKCDAQHYWVVCHPQNCKCQGTGEIVSLLTLGEAEEYLKILVDGKPLNYAVHGRIRKGGGG